MIEIILNWKNKFNKMKPKIATYKKKQKNS